MGTVEHGFKISKPMSSDTVPPARIHLLYLPKQHHKMGIKCKRIGAILIQTSNIRETTGVNITVVDRRHWSYTDMVTAKPKKRQDSQVQLLCAHCQQAPRLEGTERSSNTDLPL